MIGRAPDPAEPGAVLTALKTKPAVVARPLHAPVSTAAARGARATQGRGGETVPRSNRETGFSKRDCHDCQWKPAMPRPRLGLLPMTAAERQARHRARQRRAQDAAPAAPRPRPPPRPHRWAAAVAALVALQDEYRAWLGRLPQSLAESPTAEKLQAITEIDLDELLAIDPPLGYGRD
jgi:hypothetical protein